MTELTDSLPDRPLSTGEISALEAQHDDYGFAPVGFFPDLDVVAADVVLLIARFLDRVDADDLATMIAAARERGFQVLVEAHTREEVRQAVAAGADVVGVNNRDLARLEVDLSTVPAVAPAAPESVTLIAESGVSTPDDVTRMRDAGADAVLVGSAIMDGDVEANARRLTGATSTDTDQQ